MNGAPSGPAAPAEQLQIGAVADRTGLSVKTIRHYDSVGLVVPSARSAGGFRLYTGLDIDRLLSIRGLKPLGFSLDEMRQLLAALDTLEAVDATALEHSEARAHVIECHRRAQAGCRKLARQLAYARELTDQLARHRE